jgi:dTDP-4-dehydrorhamnose reductase
VTRVLLIGAFGRLGTAIRERWSDCEINAPSHDELDVTNEAQLRDALRATIPDVLVNTAAFHDVDRCEAEPMRAFEVNAIAVGRAARLASDAGAVFLTVSTDYVFDGATDRAYTENDAPHPLSVYGVSKLSGEYFVAAQRGRAFVVRTCGLYGRSTAHSRRPSLIERVISNDFGGQPARIVADVIASPTFAGDLADALRRLLETRAYGLYHAANDGAVSWYDFASEAARRAGVAVALEPIGRDEWKAPAMRPRFSALSNAKLGGLSIAMPSWRDGIAAYLAHAVR